MKLFSAGLLGRSFIVWILIIFAETVHGILRVMTLEPRIGDLRARQVAIFTGSAIIFGIAYIFIRWIKAPDTWSLFFVGIFWMVLTVGFEVVLGRLVMGFSWDRIIAEYNILTGSLMPLGLAFLVVVPLLAARLKDLRERRQQSLRGERLGKDRINSDRL
jgi:hypothetical protein